MGDRDRQGPGAWPTRGSGRTCQPPGTSHPATASSDGAGCAGSTNLSARSWTWSNTGRRWTLPVPVDSARRSEVGRAGRPTGASGAPPPARPQQAAHLDVAPGQLLDRSASDEAHDTQRLAAGRTRPPRARRPHRACVSWVIRTVTIAGSAPCSRYRRLLAPLRSRHAETARGARSVGLVADYGLH